LPYNAIFLNLNLLLAFLWQHQQMSMLGLINSNHTHEMDLSFGNRLNALELAHQMATGEGFGVTVGQGVRRMKAIFSQKFGADPGIMQDIGMEAKGLEFAEYVSKESLAQQGGLKANGVE
jgi:aldehyde:ferredoxin oxidoreductase